MTLRRTMAIAVGLLSVATAVAILAAETPPGSATRPAGSYPLRPNRTALPGEAPALSEQQETELLNAMKDRRPEAYDMLMNLRKSDPGYYRQALQKAWRWHQEFQQQPKEVQQASLAEQNAGIKVYRAAQAYHHADPNSPEQAKIKEQLTAAVTEHFQMEQKKLELQLAQMQKRIAEVSADLKDREAHRDQFIADRVAQFMQHRPGGYGPTSKPVGP